MHHKLEIELNTWNSNRTPKYQVKVAIDITDQLKNLFSKYNLLSDISILLENLLKIFQKLDRHDEFKHTPNHSNYDSQLEEDNHIDIRIEDNIRTLCKQLIRLGKQLIITSPKKINFLSEDQSIIKSFSSLKKLSELILEQYDLIGKDNLEFKTLHI